MTWWQYLILANVYLILFYGFYVLLLRRETFFQLNRFYLVGSAILSFLVPLIQADWARSLFITQKINQTIYHLEPVMVYQLQPKETNSFTLGLGLAIIYLAGILVLALRFSLQLLLLQRSLRNPDTDAAYSFFKSIKLSDKLTNRGVIMAHEQVHAQQWHSADVLLIEAIMIINWFNPAVYLYRKAIKHIHEFIADRNAVQSGTSKQEYAILLLSETFKTPAHQLVNPFFNHSLLKQRILMLQKNNSQRTALLKYGLSAPLFALMLILSSATVKTNEVINIINEKAEQVMLLQAAPNTIDDSYTVTSSISAKNHTTSLTVSPNVKDFEPTGKPVSETIAAADTGKIFASVEHSAEFPGGLQAFGQYLGRNIRYPAQARKNNVQGRVIIQFVVERDGSLSDIHILRGIGSGCDEEALRVMMASPKWVAGTQNGKKIRQQYTVPISFTLQRTGALPKLPTLQDTAIRTNTFYYVQEPAHGIADTIKRMRVITLNSKKDTTLHPLQTVVVTDNNIASALYYVDGVKSDKAKLSAIKPENIQSINIVKKSSAQQLEVFPQADNTVISITTRHKK